MSRFDHEDDLSLIPCPPVGVVLFDTPKDPGAGWASVRGEDAKRIRGPGDLHSDVLWVTNLGFYDYLRFRHLGGRLRRSDFFRTELGSIAREMGMDIQREPFAAVSTLAEVADRTSRIARDFYSIRVFGETLRDTVTSTLFDRYPLPPTYGSPSIDQAIRSAYKTHQSCGAGKVYGAQGARFRWSRTHYCTLMMRYPVPTGRWHIYSGKDVPRTNKGAGPKSELFQFLVDLGRERPALCQVSFLRSDPEISDLLEVGDANVMREWLPVQEAAQMCVYGEMHIKNLLVCDGYELLDTIPEFTPPHSSTAELVSMSHGLLSDIHWVSLASPRVAHINRKIRQEKVPTPTAVWMRAWDRITCLQAALVFQQNGITVSSYGLGAINLALTPDDYGTAVSLGINQGLTPPIWLLESIETEEGLHNATYGGSQ